MSFDLFHKFLNSEMFCFFHNCTWQSWYSEVNVWSVFAASSDFWIQFNSFIQLSFEGNRSWWSRWYIYFLVHDFSRFNHNYFRDTTSWECVVKDDCITSCLIELQSFSLSKLLIDPIHRTLVSFPLLLLVRCKTWFGQVKLIRIFVVFVHGIHSRREFSLSFPAWILSSRYINP